MHAPVSQLAISSCNPRELLDSLLATNPGLSKDDLFAMFRTVIAGHAGHQRAVDWYFFTSMYGEMTTRGHAPQQRDAPKQRAERATRRDVVVESIKAQIVILKLVMPNGKPMGECTGAEMAKFGNRYQRVAEKVGKTKIVGDVLSEEQVREIVA